MPPENRPGQGLDGENAVFCRLSSILGGEMSSRLFQTIREKRGLVYSIYSMQNPYHNTGSLVVYAGCAPENAAQVVRLTVKEFAVLRDKLVSREELKRVKRLM
jgi:predicted Zn-dependent peptidase